MDEASGDLLLQLCREVAGRAWLIGVTRRNEASGFAAPAGEATVSLHLDTLPEEKVVELLIAATEESPLRPHEMSILARRSGGNPLFLQELLSATRVAGTTEGLPDTVEAMVTAQIDQLASTDRRRLRVASVLGLRFRSALAEQLLDEPATAGAAAWRRLDDFVTQDGAGFYRFRHALMRDAAYEGLAYRRRRELHLRAGEAIEREPRERTTPTSTCWRCTSSTATCHDKAWRLLATGRRRRRAEVRDRGCRRAPGAGAAERARRGGPAGRGAWPRRSKTLGDLRERMGQYPQAAQRLQRARDGCCARRRRRAGPALLQALRAGGAKRQLPAGAALAAARYAAAGGPHRRPAAAQQLRAADRVLRADPPGAGAAAGRGALAEPGDRGGPAGERAGGAGARLLHPRLGAGRARARRARPCYSERALELYDAARQARAAGHDLQQPRACSRGCEGRWDEAVELYDKGRQLRVRIGDEVDAATGTHNIAEVLSDQGRLDEARPLFEEALRVWRAAEFGIGVAYATSSLGQRRQPQRRLRARGRAVRRRPRAVPPMVSESELVDTDARIAEALVFQGRSRGGDRADVGARWSGRRHAAAPRRTRCCTASAATRWPSAASGTGAGDELRAQPRDRPRRGTPATRWPRRWTRSRGSQRRAARPTRRRGRRRTSCSRRSGSCSCRPCRSSVGVSAWQSAAAISVVAGQAVAVGRQVDARPGCRRSRRSGSGCRAGRCIDALMQALPAGRCTRCRRRPGPAWAARS